MLEVAHSHQFGFVNSGGAQLREAAQRTPMPFAEIKPTRRATLLPALRTQPVTYPRKTLKTRSSLERVFVTALLLVQQVDVLQPLRRHAAQIMFGNACG